LVVDAAKGEDRSILVEIKKAVTFDLEIFNSGKPSIKPQHP